MCTLECKQENRPFPVFSHSVVMEALLAFLQAHAGDGVLDAAAMAQLDALLPVLGQGVALGATLTVLGIPWVDGLGVEAPLHQAQVFTLTQYLLLQVIMC